MIVSLAFVAQLVERGFCKADVASSNLVEGFRNHSRWKDKPECRDCVGVGAVYPTLSIDVLRQTRYDKYQRMGD